MTPFPDGEVIIEGPKQKSGKSGPKMDIHCMFAKYINKVTCDSISLVKAGEN